MVRTCVDSALEDLQWLEDNPGLSITMKEQIQTLKMELRFIRIFVLYMKNRRDVSKDDGFQSLLTSIEASLSSATKDLYGDGLLVMYNRRKTRVWGQNLLEKINHLKQEIRLACDVWCESSLQINSTIDDVKAALEFLDPLLENLDSLVALKPDMTLSMKKQFETLKGNLQFLRDLVTFTSKQYNENAEWENLLTLIGTVSCNAACLSYICWVDEKIGSGTNAMLSNLLQVLKPNTFNDIEMYLGLLKVPHPAGLNVAFKCKVVESVVDFLFENLVVHVECEFEILREQLVLLLMYLMDPLGEESQYREKMLILTELVVNEAQSLLKHSCKIDLTAKEMQSEVSLLLSKLHEKVKFVVMEVSLMELQNHNSDWMDLIKNYTNALHEGHWFLIDFLMDPQKKSTEDWELMHVYMEEVVKEAGSLIDTVDEDQLTENLVTETNLRLVKLFGNIELIKQVELLIKLLNQKGSKFVLEMDIEMELNFIKAFLMGLPKEYKTEEKLMLTQIGGVVNDTISILDSTSNKERKENTAMEVNPLLSSLSEQIKSVKAEVSKAYLQASRSSMSNFPSTDGAGFVDFFIVHLGEVLSEKVDRISQIKNHVEIILRELEFLRPFLGHNEQEELQDYRGHIMDLAYQAENAIDLYLVKGADAWYCILWLSQIIEDIMVIKKDAPKTCESTSVSKVINVQNTSNRELSLEYNITTNGFVVGLESKVEDIKNRLLGGGRELEIIPIVGTAGLGKTTLAKNVYEDPSIRNRFHIRAWCYVSQVYNLRDLVLEILTQVIKSTDEIDNKRTAEDLAELLYRSLMGRKYLIILDDIWDIEAWRSLRPSFTDNMNSSRIIFTSRLHKLASQAGVRSDLYSLHPFTENECLELWENMLFRKDGWPEELSVVGKEIARRCDGLPLLVVVIGGVLAQIERTEEKWKAIEENLKSTVPGDPKHFVNKLDMSYKNLPDHLKACFLYLGVFAFEREIPVWKLIRLWIAEGLVRNPEDGSIEDTAESYLKELIDRSLVMVAKRRSNGRVKACNIHNLLRDLCLRRVAEENFLQPIRTIEISGSEMNLFLSPKHYDHRRLCIYSKREDLVSSVGPFSPRARSLLFFASGDAFRLLEQYDMSLIFQSFKILRVLDLSSINIGNSFPKGLVLLTHLRFLAIRGNFRSLPASIVNLQNLETLLVKGLRGEIGLPETFWKMKRLRHVQILGRVLIMVDYEYGVYSEDKFSNLETLTTPSFYYSCWGEVMSTLRRLPGLRKLRCVLLESWNNGKFPKLDLLLKLESLKVFNHGYLSYPCHFHLPHSLKKLTLSKFRLPWDAIKEIGRLPNLEVLKLLNQAFRGHKWEVKSGEFQKLKYLKLKSLDIVEWDVSTEQFPLEQLVVERCEYLEEIPICLREIQTLQLLQVQWCNSFTANAARDVEEEQVGNGNEAIKVLIYPRDF